MKFTSNISGVLRHLGRFEAQLPEALAETTDPKRWLGPLRRVAESALMEVAEPEERAYIPLFLSTMEIAVFGPGMAYEMSNPFVAGKENDAVSKAQGITEGLDLRTYGDVKRARRQPLEATPEQALTLEQVRLAILEWVQLEKVKTEVDAGLSDEEIADRIGWIIGVNPGSHRDRTANMDNAGAALAAHVQAFMEERSEHRQGLSPRRIRLWLVAVLNAWRGALLSGLPQAVAMNLRKLWRETGEKLL
jgi:hypothetical protein